MFDLSKLKNSEFGDIKKITSKIDPSKISGNIDSSKINSIIDKVGNLVDCDEDCKKNKHLQKLMDRILELQRERDTNPEELKKSIQEYITKSKGDSAYNKYLYNKYTRETEIIVNKNLDTLDNLYNDLKDKINHLNSNSKSNDFINYLIEQKEKEKNNLKNTIDNEIHNTLTNERRALYKSEQSNFIQKIKTFMIVLYYIILFLYFVFEFVLQKQYNNYKNWLLLVFYLLIPIIIVNFTFSISNLLIEFYSSLKNNFKIEDI